MSVSHLSRLAARTSRTLASSARSPSIPWHNSSSRRLSTSSSSTPLSDLYPHVRDILPQSLKQDGWYILVVRASFMILRAGNCAEFLPGIYHLVVPEARIVWRALLRFDEVCHPAGEKSSISSPTRCSYEGMDVSWHTTNGHCCSGLGCC